MGLLDRFKKKDSKIPTTQSIRPTQQNPSRCEIKYSATKDGRLQIDFYDKEAEFGQFYDTTRLIVDSTKTSPLAQNLYKCQVSWYAQDDTIYWNRSGEEIGRRVAYEDVQVQLNLDMLQRNPQYTEVLMRDLLNQNRVERYLQTGLDELATKPCGDYVGGVYLKPETNRFKKFFNPELGKKVHYSYDMKQKRREYQERQERARQEKISSKQKEINRIQSEIDDLSK